MLFKTRTDAGKLLAKKVVAYIKENHPKEKVVVFALPRGGVPIGYEIALALDTPIELIIPRKIGHPINPEYAIAAVTENGNSVCNETELSSIDHDWFKTECQHEMAEAKRRRHCYLGDAYLKNREPISAKGKITIIVDDGIATGLTMRAAIEDIRRKKPNKIFIAVPVVAKHIADILSEQTDAVIAALIDHNYRGSVSHYYGYFHQLCDDEVLYFLKKLKEQRQLKQ